ncbi:50S ribosomal protein L19 [Wolbachia endosymbiont of Cruorifilaria tuberocauda]|uniref:50S ribosomal protein L19 n=1 Tax=Wolbachia endosymbiont of Cruorifilaria tuberocauda TaxID=1812111 RepID=UPI00158B1C63|nr:50S ribosomal protein L19 [Wolbachia endosymbiont of Cruorifilaria tuberocauda]QKX01471.1 50S ribosomal protein L19 [Wolbachia endosymbiont of Cruorifilaria tuberocauda]
MKNLLEYFNKKQMEMLVKEIPKFRPGDDLKVTFKMADSTGERIQIFEGVCLSEKSRGLHSSFIVRKVSHGESIVSQFFVYSPALVSVQVTRSGKARRAKLYYLCKLFGKAARVKGRTTYNSNRSK